MKTTNVGSAPPRVTTNPEVPVAKPASPPPSPSPSAPRPSDAFGGAAPAGALPQLKRLSTGQYTSLQQRKAPFDLASAPDDSYVKVLLGKGGAGVGPLIEQGAALVANADPSLRPQLEAAVDALTTLRDLPPGKLTAGDVADLEDAADTIANARAPLLGQLPADAVLKSGSTGEGVKALQTLLGLQPADGKFGPKTEAALKAFQQSHGLTADGKAGRATFEALKGTTAPATPAAATAVAPTGDAGAISTGLGLRPPSQVDPGKDSQLSKAVAELEKERPGRGVINAMGVGCPASPDGKTLFERHGVDPAEVKRFVETGEMGPTMAAMWEESKHPPKKMWGDEQLRFQEAQAFSQFVFKVSGKHLAQERTAVKADTSLSAPDKKAKLDDIAKREHAAYNETYLPVLRAGKQNHGAWVGQVQREATSNAKAQGTGATQAERDLAAKKAQHQFGALAIDSRAAGDSIGAARNEIQRGKVEIAAAEQKGEPLKPAEVKGLQSAAADLANVKDPNTVAYQDTTGDLNSTAAHAADVWLTGKGLSVTGKNDTKKIGALPPVDKAEVKGVADLALASREEAVKNYGTAAKLAKDAGDGATAKLEAEKTTAAKKELDLKRGSYEEISNAAKPKETSTHAHDKESDAKAAADAMLKAQALRARDAKLKLDIPSVKEAKARLAKVENPKVVKALIESPEFKKLDARTQAQVLMAAANYPGSTPYLQKFIASENFKKPNLDGKELSGQQAEVARARLLHVTGAMGERLRAYDSQRAETKSLSGYEQPMSDTEAAMRNSLGRMSSDDVKVNLVYNVVDGHFGKAGLNAATGKPEMEYNLGNLEVNDATDPLKSKTNGLTSLTLHELNHLQHPGQPPGRNATYFFDEFQAFRTGSRGMAQRGGKDWSPDEAEVEAKRILASYDEFKGMDVSMPKGERLRQFHELQMREASGETLNPDDAATLARFEEEQKIRRTLADVYGVREEDIKSDGGTDAPKKPKKNIDQALQDNGHFHGNRNDPNDLELEQGRLPDDPTPPPMPRPD